mmetsp:Transcript_33549/g.71920  ORF Transcript_33549/g.71920 Transcript_33549/m.71920 type:complete len:172 (+) Transcript_33549:3-518(+)
MMVSLVMMESPQKTMLGCSSLSAMAWIAILISTACEGDFVHRFTIILGLLAKGTVVKRALECEAQAPEWKRKEVSICMDHLHLMDGGCLVLCAFFPNSLFATLASSTFDVGIAWTGCLLLKRTDILLEALGYQSLQFLIESSFEAPTSASAQPPAQTKPKQEAARITRVAG